ncbi:MAG: MFS transporter [Actinomycetota bacterium]|nr:MFS transporter [Actinomycetota bacterium]
MATERDEGVRKVYKDRNLHVLWGVTLMAVLGTSSITPAFPSIVRALGISSRQVGLLITVFTLPGIVMTPLLGVLSDRYGRKRILSPPSSFSALPVAPAPSPAASTYSSPSAFSRGWGPPPSGHSTSR